MNKIGLPLALAAVLFGQGATCSRPPKIDSATVVVSGGASENKLASAVTVKTPAAVAADDAAQKKRLSAVAASVAAMPAALVILPDSPAKTAVSTEQEIAAANLKDVWVSPEDHSAAIQRVSQTLAGEIDLANASKASALAQAGVANSERDLARKERDAALASQKQLVADSEKERATNKLAYEARLKELGAAVVDANDRADKAIDQARKERDGLLSKVILGLSSACFLAGAAILILTSGKELVRGGIALACAAVGFACYWTLNQPWFIYVAWTAIGLIVAVVVGLIIYEWHERKQKVANTKELQDYDAVWATGKKVMKVLDNFRANASVEAKPLFDALERELDSSHKIILADLRHEVAVTEKPSA